jgi:hypothetical protein
MVIKKFYENDNTKSLWRKEISKFIKKHYSKDKLRNLRVLCLPGHEMLEIFEIYDKLGIKRENITGIEGNYEVFKILSKKNDSLTKKIKIFHCSLERFLHENKISKPFYIISLDFTSYFDSEKMNLLKSLSKKKLINKKAILITNYPQGRSHTNIEKNIKFIEDFSRQVKTNDKKQIYTFFMEKNSSILKDKQDINNSESYNLDLDTKIQLGPVDCLIEGTYWETDLFKQWENKLKKALDKDASNSLKKNITLLKKGEKFSGEFIRYLFFIEENLQPQRISFILLIPKSEVYFPEDHEAFIYKSESGTTMLSDFYLFKEFNQSDSYVNDLKYVFEKDFLKVDFKDRTKLIRTLSKMKSSVEDYAEKVIKIKNEFPKKKNRAQPLMKNV